MRWSDGGTAEAPLRQKPSLGAVRLASTLARSLDAVVPRPLTVEADGDRVTAGRGALKGAVILGPVLDQVVSPDDADAAEWTFPRRVARVAWNVLSGVQDTVAEETAEPWPRLPDGSMALPGTRTDGERVFLWFGPSDDSEAGAVLMLPPILLSDLVDAP